MGLPARRQEDTEARIAHLEVPDGAAWATEMPQAGRFQVPGNGASRTSRRILAIHATG